MILGLGTDIIDIRRIEKILANFGNRFIKRVFTYEERTRAEQYSKTSRDRASIYAKRYAAKEACAKALGTGFCNGIFWHDLSIINLSTGAPMLSLTGVAKVLLTNLLPNGMKARIDLTMTDEYPMAVAIVIISAEVFYKSNIK
ncbi:MAG: holo-ACP synthase [Rhodospirillaceae bacterium]|jgi:holo-[acyl-carrier protein] synthase|nr:holo-ACP synthase [Rhodospirillaceae bacterium]